MARVGYQGNFTDPGCTCTKVCFWTSVGVIFATILVTSFTVLFMCYPPPTTFRPPFRVESVLVSIDRDNANNDTAAAEWDFVVFARNPNKNKFFNFNYRQFDVFIQSGSQDWLLAANVGSFRQGPKNTTLINVNVKTPLPAGYRGGDGMVWDLSVMLKAKINGDEVIEAFCRNMKVAFKQNATTGQLVGSRIKCPVEMSDFGVW